MFTYTSTLLAWLKLFVFRVVNAVFRTIRNIVWHINGTMAEITRSRDSLTNCHRMRVVFSFYTDVIMHVSQSNFVLLHDGFVATDHVLRDDVSLLRVTRTEAIFVEQDKTMPPAFSNQYSFAAMGQITTARYLIFVPLRAFLKLAELSENNEEKIVIVHNIGRCGGTLFTRCFEATGRAVAWNEPKVIDPVITQANFYWNRNTTKAVIRATFLMLAKTYRGLTKSTLAYVIKPSVPNCHDADLIFETLPKARHVLVYRDVNAAAKSCHKACMLVPSLHILELTKFFKHPHALAYWMTMLQLNGRGFDDITFRYPVLLEFSYRMHLNSFRAYYRLRDKGVPIRAVRYEDLVSQPDRILPQLLKLASIPEDLASLAKTALIRDSQSTVPFSRQAMAAFRSSAGAEDWDEEFLEEMQALYAQYGVPGPLDWKKDPQVIPGTIQ